MFNTRLISLLVGYMVAMLFCSLLYSVSFALIQDAAAIRQAYLTVIVKVNGGPAVASAFNIEVSSDDEIEVVPSTFEGNELGTEVALYLPLTDALPSIINYTVTQTLNGDSSPEGYSVETSGCEGSVERGDTATCEITNNYEELIPPSEFQIVTNPQQLTIGPGLSGFSTITLIPAEGNSRENSLDIELDAEWVDTPPADEDVNVILEEESTRLVGTEQKNIGLTVSTSSTVPPEETLTLSVIADGVDQQNHRVSHTRNIEIITLSSNNNENNAPIAVADLDKEEVNEGESVRLDGAGSTDLDGEDLTYSWEVLGAPADMNIPDDKSDDPSLIYETPRVNEDTTLTFRLTVTDGKPGGVGIDTTELRLNDLGSDPPNNERSTNPLNGLIPQNVRDIATQIAPPVAGLSSDNILPLALLASVIIIVGIAVGKYKMSRGRSRRLKIPPSAIVEIKPKGGISR